MLIRPTYSILISAPRLWLCWLFVAMTTLGSDEKALILYWLERYGLDQLIITQDFHNTRPHQVVFIMEKFLESNGFDRKVLNKRQVSLSSQNLSSVFVCVESIPMV